MFRAFGKRARTVERITYYRAGTPSYNDYLRSSPVLLLHCSLSLALRQLATFGYRVLRAGVGLLRGLLPFQVPYNGYGAVAVQQEEGASAVYSAARRGRAGRVRTRGRFVGGRLTPAARLLYKPPLAVGRGLRPLCILSNRKMLCSP